MIRKYGNMLANLVSGDIYLVTTNSYIRKDGALVMGRGAAKQLATMFPRLPYLLGNRITHLGEYNVGVLTQINEPKLSLGAFQVKFNFADAADLDLITRSRDELHQLACEDGRVFHVNFPGIGNGRLAFDDVLPIMETLPDNVCVWTFCDHKCGYEPADDGEGDGHCYQCGAAK